MCNDMVTCPSVRDMRFRSSLLSCSVVFFVGLLMSCGQPNSAFDSGVDAGQGMDAGSDAGTKADAGTSSDAGTTADAGAPFPLDGGFFTPGTISLIIDGTGFDLSTYTRAQRVNGLLTAISGSAVAGYPTISLITAVDAGTFACGSNPATSMVLVTAQGSFYAGFTSGTCEVTISSYGPVGFPIEGTFFGTLLVTDGGTESVSIDAGSFRVIRNVDQ
jgi:hypothetical protein